MPRRKRNWHPNAYFHVIMRGNNRQSIFRTEEDVMQLMRIFEYASEKLHFKMLAFCIMTNHYHLLIRSEYVDLAKVMAQINRRYSDYYAKRYSHVGRIYEKRYFSKEADGPQAILAISSYIHRNPIDTQVPMVEKLEDYPYSSFPYYVNENQKKPSFLRTDIVAHFLPHPFDKTNQAYCLYCLTYKQDVEEDT
ncbi:transposase [Sporosarcina sp. YIM B06819]|uniref:transposase n=1 Tax=Sporosarcina sp. YIM B06819 TaxID=3081769 RepID=UPI00298D5A79|nr:transposase [Sporosarcina sp. YIM B06819]